MNHQELSKRLEKVAEFIPTGSRLADIGSDHGYLPVSLALKGKLAAAVAGEVVEGPYLSAKHQVEKDGLADVIDVRLADGLDAIEPQDAIDVITICGMGGALICNILEKGWQNQRLNGQERLVLQPNIGERLVREWLIAHQYAIIHEAILEENEKIYEIIVAEPRERKAVLTEAELLFGPWLLKEKNQAFQKKWHHELRQRQKILANMQQAGTTQISKEQDFEHEISMIQEVLDLQ